MRVNAPAPAKPVTGLSDDARRRPRRRRWRKISQRCSTSRAVARAGRSGRPALRANHGGNDRKRMIALHSFRAEQIALASAADSAVPGGQPEGGRDPEELVSASELRPRNRDLYLAAHSHSSEILNLKWSSVIGCLRSPVSAARPALRRSAGTGSRLDPDRPRESAGAAPRATCRGGSAGRAGS